MSARTGFGQRRIRVTPEVIEAWLVKQNRVRTGLPEDSRFVRMWPSDAEDVYVVVFESAEWEELEEGEEIPVLEIEVEAVERLEHRVETLEGEPERTNAHAFDLDDGTDPDLLTGEAAPDAKERIDMAHTAGGPTR